MAHVRQKSFGFVKAALLGLSLSFLTSGAGYAKDQISIQLFGATFTFSTGPLTSSAEAIPFASTSLILQFSSDDTAVISSTPDGQGPIVIDNFMNMNGTNICAGHGGPSESCFGGITNPALPLGEPIETVEAPIEPIDVSKSIPAGTTTLTFELSDFGVIAGNTDLFLVTTAAVISPPRPHIEAAWCCGNWECTRMDPKTGDCAVWKGTSCNPSDTTIAERKLCHLGATAPGGVVGSWMNCAGEQFTAAGGVINCRPQ